MGTTKGQQPMSSSDAVQAAYEELQNITDDLEKLERRVLELQRTIGDSFPTASEGLYIDDLGPADHPEHVLSEAQGSIAQVRGLLAQAHTPLADARARISRLGTKEP